MDHARPAVFARTSPIRGATHRDILTAVEPLAQGRGVRRLDVKQLFLGLASALFVVAVPLCILTASAVASIFDPTFYTEQEVAAGVVETYGLPRTVLAQANEGMVRYFTGEFATLPEAFKAAGGDPAFFSERELVHMTDVRTLFQQIVLVERVALGYGAIFLLGSFLLLGSAAIRRDGQLLLLGVGFGLAIFVLGGAAWLIDPSGLFLWFHKLYFSNDFWQLDPRTDHLIQMVPFPFWEAAIFVVIGRALAVTALTAVLGGLAAWLGGRLVGSGLVGSGPVGGKLGRGGLG